MEFGETDYTHLKLLKRLKDYNILTITVIIELIHFFVGFEDGFNKQFNHDWFLIQIKLSVLQLCDDVH